MKISFIYLLSAVNFVTTVVTYYRKCYEEFSVCLITDTDYSYYAYHYGNFRLNQASANDWCKVNSSSLAIITNKTVQSALAAFINDSSAKLFWDVITNANRSKLNYWEWTSGRKKDEAIYPLVDYYSYKYAYLRAVTGRNITFNTALATSKRNFICRFIRDSNCPDGHHQMGNGCYKIHDITATWFNARNLCLQEGSDLATFEEVDISSISGWLLNGNYWIGLRKEKWYWIYGQRSEEIKYSKWNDNSPSAYTNGDCLCLIPNTGKWTDCDCSQKYRYICIQDYVPESSSSPVSTTTILITTTTTQTTSSSSPVTIRLKTSTTHTVSHSNPILIADDNSRKLNDFDQGSGMLLVIGLGIACLVILIVIVAVVVFIKLRRSQSHDPGPSHDSPSTTTMTKEDAPNNVYAVIMPSQSIRSPSEKSPNKIIYAELDLVPKGNTLGTAPQELVYANTIQPDSVYANCANTRV